jgi:hypothetical protein
MPPILPTLPPSGRDTDIGALHGLSINPRLGRDPSGSRTERSRYRSWSLPSILAGESAAFGLSTPEPARPSSGGELVLLGRVRKRRGVGPGRRRLAAEEVDLDLGDVPVAELGVADP